MTLRFWREDDERRSTSTGCFLEKYPPKETFWNIFTSAKSFCVKFCRFVGNSYPHDISTNFCRFISVFHQNGVNVSTSTHRLHPVKLWVGLYSHRKWKCPFLNTLYVAIEREVCLGEHLASRDPRVSQDPGWPVDSLNRSRLTGNNSEWASKVLRRGPTRFSTQLT